MREISSDAGHIREILLRTQYSSLFVDDVEQARQAVGDGLVEILFLLSGEFRPLRLSMSRTIPRIAVTAPSGPRRTSSRSDCQKVVPSSRIISSSSSPGEPVSRIRAASTASLSQSSG